MSRKVVFLLSSISSTISYHRCLETTEHGSNSGSGQNPIAAPISTGHRLALDTSRGSIGANFYTEDGPNNDCGSRRDVNLCNFAEVVYLWQPSTSLKNPDVEPKDFEKPLLEGRPGLLKLLEFGSRRVLLHAIAQEI